jgi:hypothetical protein
LSAAVSFVSRALATALAMAGRPHWAGATAAVAPGYATVDYRRIGVLG